VVDWSGGVLAGCMLRVQLYVNACNGWLQFALLAPVALANQLPLPAIAPRKSFDILALYKSDYYYYYYY